MKAKLTERVWWPFARTSIFLVAVAALLSHDGIAQEKDSSSEPWEQAMREAHSYFASGQPERSVLVEKYNNILALNPPREIELHVRLLIGARMTVLYDPQLGESALSDEAVPWYEAIVEDFADWPNHYDLLVAKIHLGDLYRALYGESRIQDAEVLYQSVLSVQENSIVFDSPDYSYLNIEEINTAQAVGARLAPLGGGRAIRLPPTNEENLEYRTQLMEERKAKIDILRRATSNQIALAKTDPTQPDLTISRLHELVKTRPNDEVFQKAVRDYIAWFKRESRSFASSVESVAKEEGQEAPE